MWEKGDIAKDLLNSNFMKYMGSDFIRYLLPGVFVDDHVENEN